MASFAFRQHQPTTAEIMGAINELRAAVEAYRSTVIAAMGLCQECGERPRLEAYPLCGTCWRIGAPDGEDAA